MSRLFGVGDTHWPDSITKLKTHIWEGQRNLTKDDFVIIAGDCGEIFDWWNTGQSIESNPLDKCWSRQELFWLKWINDRNYKTLFIDGNHENFDRLKTYPVIDFKDAKAQLITDSFIHLMRGQIYKFSEEETIFTFGGAISTDRGPAVGKEAEHIHKIWWPEEKPSKDEYECARKNLKEHGNRVKYIFTHEAPTWVLKEMGLASNEVSEFLQEIYETTLFQKWFCGHHHRDKEFIEKESGKGVVILFNNIIEL